MSAFLICSYGIQLYMMHKGDSGDEVALIVMEDNQQARKAIRSFHNLGRKAHIHELMKSRGLESMIVTRIIDTVHFAEKASSSPLQVADACAFAIKRHLMGTPERERFYSPLKPLMVTLLKSELPANGK